MPWQLVVLSRVVSAHIVFPIIVKHLTGLPSRARKLSLQFLFCAVLSVIWLACKPQPVLKPAIELGSIMMPAMVLLLLVGGINSFAAYCQWQAIGINLSKTAVFTQADDFIAVLLGYVFLNELSFLNSFLLIGIILCFIAAGLFLGGKKSNGQSNKALLLWIAGYSFIWGVTVFLIRYFALKGVSFPVFLTGWYGGSFLGSLIILRLEEKPGLFRLLTAKTVLKVFGLAVVVWLSMCLNFWTFKLVPLTVGEPIFLVTEMIFPALIGLYLFKEKRDLTREEITGFALGALGTVIIGLSF